MQPASFADNKAILETFPIVATLYLVRSPFAAAAGRWQRRTADDRPCHPHMTAAGCGCHLSGAIWQGIMYSMILSFNIADVEAANVRFSAHPGTIVASGAAASRHSRTTSTSTHLTATYLAIALAPLRCRELARRVATVFDCCFPQLHDARAPRRRRSGGAGVVDAQAVAGNGTALTKYQEWWQRRFGGQIIGDYFAKSCCAALTALSAAVLLDLFMCDPDPHTAYSISVPLM